MGVDGGPSDCTDVRPSVRPPAASPTPVPPAEGELVSGTRVSRYVVLKHLARGGMGVVYLAYDEELDRRVALKILAPEGSGDASEAASRSARLLREAQAMAKLSHPHVVAVYDVGTFGEQVFLAMEYVDGADLRAFCEAKRHPPREIVATFVQAGRGLEAAHAAGILHRDFKPENVVVDAKGRARVLDFGVARVDAAVSIDDLAFATTGVVSSTSSRAPLTQVGALIGTPAYMAPEQLRGERAEARSDQFAFAVALFEALYGQRPFSGKTVPELVNAIARGTLPAPRSGTRIPRGVRAALQRALRAKPDDRFPAMGALLDTLERAVATKRAYVIALAAAAAVATVVGTMLVRGGAAAPVCRSGAREIAATWGPEQRNSVSESFAAARAPIADDTSQRVTRILDDYAAAWATMRDESCEATRVRGVQSDEALDLRTACLDQRRDELAATVRIFSGADGTLVENAVNAARRLGDVARCADVPALRAPYTTPHEPALRARVQAVRKQLAEATALKNAVRITDAEVVVQAASREATAIGNQQLHAAATTIMANLENRRGASERAREHYLDAALEAGAAGDAETEASAWIQLVRVAGYDFDQLADSALFARLAEAALARLGGSDELKALLLQHRAHVLYGHSKLEESLVLYRESLELRKRRYGADSVEAAKLEIDLADIAAGKGHYREAIALYEGARAKYAAGYGEWSPANAVIDTDLALAYKVVGDAKRVRASAERALREGQEPRFAAQAQIAVGIAALLDNDRVPAFAEAEAALLVARGVFRGPRLAHLIEHWAEPVLWRRYAEEALRLFDEMLEMYKSSPGHDEDIATTESDRALALARLGKGKEAMTAATSALAALEARYAGPADPRLLEPLLARGEACLAVNDAAGALGHLERANAIAESAEGYPEYHADTHLALARAIVATHGDAGRARALAERAAQEYDGARMPQLAKEARDLAASGPRE